MAALGRAPNAGWDWDPYDRVRGTSRRAMWHVRHSLEQAVLIQVDASRDELAALGKRSVLGRCGAGEEQVRAHIHRYEQRAAGDMPSRVRVPQVDDPISDVQGLRNATGRRQPC